MSVNCIKCVKNRRTGMDLLCDSCRANRYAPECPKHPGTRMVLADGSQPYHDQRTPHWRCELWVGGGVCGATRPLTGGAPPPASPVVPAPPL